MCDCQGVSQPINNPLCKVGIMKSSWPEYTISLTGNDGPHTMETCDHPRDVFQWLTSHQVLASQVSVVEMDKITNECVETQSGEEWLQKYCVLEPARWRLR